MIIDIDIKIANSNGKMIHRFSKQFDEKLDVSEQINKDSGISKDFEDFLSEYLTASGRSIRGKLISHGAETAYERYNRNQTEDGNVSAGEEAEDITDSEMEYKIFIGNNKVITGKIPFHRMNRLSKVTEAISKSDDETLKLTDKNGLSDRTEYKKAYPKKNFDLNNNEIIVDLERNLKNVMMQAVEKYESSFYHTEEEQELNL